MARSRWVDRQLRDRFVAAASAEGWRSRAAFKLMQINKKFKIIRQGYQIVDLGAAPGGWSQYVAYETNSQVRSKTTDNAMHLFKNSEKAWFEGMNPSKRGDGGTQLRNLRQVSSDTLQPFLAIDQRTGASLKSRTSSNSGSRFSTKKKRRDIMDIAADEAKKLHEGEISDREEVGSSGSLVAGSRVCVTKTRLLSVDLLPIQPIPGSIFICGDFDDANVRETLTKYLRRGKADVVLSDMSHSFVGDSITDAVKQTQLSDLAFQYAKKVLRRDGHFVTKMRDGCDEANALVNDIKQYFEHVERIKPEASRNESAEYFIVAQHFRRSGVFHPKLAGDVRSA